MPLRISPEFFKRRPPWLLPSLLAAASTFFLYRAISAYQTRLGMNLTTEGVVMTARALPQGAKIEEGDLLIQQVPRKYLPLGTVRSEDVRGLLGLVITQTTTAKQLLLWSMIDVGAYDSSPARRVMRDYRALTVQVDSTSSVGQAIRPGDHVDLISTLQLPDQAGLKTLTLLQNIAVLDVGEANAPAGSLATSYSTVSLMVLPKEVGIITFAQRFGKITFVLRNPEDHRTPQDLPVVGFPELLEVAFRNSIQQERNRAVEIIRGGKSGPEGSHLD